MSSIMRWRNRLMGLSVMAITPVSHEVSEPHDLETGRAILFTPTSNPTRARPLGPLPRERFSPWGIADGRDRRVRMQSARTDNQAGRDGRDNNKKTVFSVLALRPILSYLET